MQALTGLYSGSATFAVVGRKVPIWTELAQFPALYFRNVAEQVLEREARGLPARHEMHVEAWLFCKVAPNDPSCPALNDLLDAFEAVIDPYPGVDVQTLGNRVSHCWIEGQIEIDPGDVDAIGKAVIPLRILVP